MMRAFVHYLMKIYFAAAVSINREKYLSLYKDLATEITGLGHEILSQQVIDAAVDPSGGLEPDELFQREAELVEQAEVLVAEVTAPSWGTAILMEHALEHGIPVLALFYKDSDHKLPTMIEGHPEVYIAHYNQSNMKSVLRSNLKHFARRKELKGKLVVIDGADGAGKATQTELLKKYLKEKKIKYKTISFPRYKTSFHGQLVGRFLKGEFGGNQEVSPYLASLAFALDRLTARDEIIEWLREGNLVIADRYVSSGIAHQGAKLPPKKRQKFMNWIYEMEYKEHQLPKESALIFLHIPAAISQHLLEKKSKKKNNHGHKDEAEKDVEHQRDAIQMYHKLVKKYPNWHTVECVDKKGQLLNRETIHRKIVQLLRQQKII